MNGFLQRVDNLRKYALGALMLVGESEERPPWNLCGVWLFRGQDIPAEVCSSSLLKGMLNDLAADAGVR